VSLSGSPLTGTACPCRYRRKGPPCGSGLPPPDRQRLCRHRGGAERLHRLHPLGVQPRVVTARQVLGARLLRRERVLQPLGGHGPEEPSVQGSQGMGCLSSPPCGLPTGPYSGVAPSYRVALLTRFGCCPFHPHPLFFMQSLLGAFHPPPLFAPECRRSSNDGPCRRVTFQAGASASAYRDG